MASWVHVAGWGLVAAVITTVAVSLGEDISRGLATGGIVLFWSLVGAGWTWWGTRKEEAK